MRKLLKPIAWLIIVWGKVTNKVWQELQKSLFAECGASVTIGRHCTFIYDHIHIGNDVAISERASFVAAISNIYIGNHVIFGPNVTIVGGNHRIDVVGEYLSRIKDKLPENDRDVVIEDDVWIGCNTTILSGVTIGQGCIIGAGSVVTKSVPPYTVLVGSPARRSWERWDAETIDRHKRLLQGK